jgi:hypothetical protein
VGGTDIKVSIVSKPFIMSAVILVFAGSIIGSIWMMSLLGADIPYMRGAFALHRTFQVDGFLTLLIMGVGYMIVPRFRNVSLPSEKLAYFSLLLVLFSIAMSVAVSVTGSNLAALGVFARFFGVTIFAGMTLWTLRVRPRLLRMADYFIALSIVTLLAVNVFQVLGYANSSQLGEVQMLLLFPILMVFGIEYKTLPSFLGFIRPSKKLSLASLGLASASVALGLLSMTYSNQALAISFNAALLGCAITFAGAVYTFGGFDYSEILSLVRGEKKARYMYTIRHSRLAFIFLYAGIAAAIAFNGMAGNYILYDLAIHYAAIGFIGITIALYLPLMLPPITGRTIHFTKFNSAPILLVIAALAIRTGGDIAIATHVASSANYFWMLSGWLVLAALFVFVTMIHSSMREIGSRVVGI